MVAEAFAQPRWDGQRLEIPPAWGPRVALDIDGHWFCDIEADGDGRLGLDLPFTPSGRDEFSPCIRSARDGEVLWPREIGTAPCSFAAHDDGSRRVAFEAEPMRAEVVVIVPVYNAPDAVRACLDSVLAHTSGRTRLLVIDDATPTRRSPCCSPAWKAAPACACWRMRATSVSPQPPTAASQKPVMPTWSCSMPTPWSDRTG